MKAKIIFIAFLFCAMTLYAQDQSGIVKTIGRPGQPGQPLEMVLVRVHGTDAASVSDDAGNFTLSLAHYTTGQAYSLSKVTKSGYQLADSDLIGRAFPYSADIPLEISMISNDEYYRTKSEIETRVRVRIEKEYEEQVAELKRQRDENAVSAELFGRKLVELMEHYDNVDNLVESLADRYARTDYDHLDSLEREINSLIEQGRIEEADAMIDAKNTKHELEQLRVNNQLLAQTLEEGRKAEAFKMAEYASDLKKKFDIASMKFDNQAAAGFLKERMELDASNVIWKMEYASFIREYLGSYDEAMDIYQSLLETVSDIALLASLHGSMGNIYQLQGRYEEALESYLKCVAMRETDLSIRNDLGGAYYNVASVYLQKDLYDDGLFYLDKAEQMHEEYEDSLGLADIYSARGTFNVDAGNYAEAEAYFHKSLKIRRDILGENSLNVASMYVNIAVLNSRLDRFSKAFENMGKAISIHKKLLGEEHPQIADDYLSMGSLELAVGNNDDALRYYQKSLDILDRSYSGYHPDIAEAYNKMAYYHKNVLNDISAAMSYYEKSHEIMETIYGRMHADVAMSLNNIAVTYAEMARYDKALEYHEEVLGIRKQLYGEDHHAVGDTYNNIAAILYRLDSNEDALAYQEKALEIFLRHYGEAHSTVALSYGNLGALSERVKDDQQALDYYKKSADIYGQIYGEGHVAMSAPYDNIGCLYLRYKMYDEAEAYMSEALKLRLGAYGEYHSLTAHSFNNLSQLYLAKGDLAKSEEMLKKCVDVNIGIYGERHPSVSTPLSNLSSLYLKMKEWDKALEYMLKALAIVEECYASDHPTVMLYRYGAGNVCFKAGMYAQAIPYMASVFQDSYKKQGPDDTYTRHYFMYLHQAYMGAMGAESYDGSLDESFVELNRNTIITATVGEGTPAEQMGLSGVYEVMSYEEWTLADEDMNFFTFNLSVADRPVKTYIFHRDGEFIKVQFEGRLGIQLNALWISGEDKEDIKKSFRKWFKKNR